MPDIKLRDGSGVEQTYTGVDTITVPLADGTGTWTYGLTDEELTFTNASYMFSNNSPFYNNSNYYIRRSNFNNISDMSYMFKNNDKITDLSDITINIGGDAFISNHVDLIKYDDANQIIAHIEDYFNEHDGTCETVETRK